MRKILLTIFIFTASSCFAQQGWYFLNPTPTGNPIIDIKMFNEKKGICITSYEVLLTIDGGVNWNRVYVPWVLNNINLFMVDSLTGYIALDSGKVVKTTNGGVNWYYSGKILSANINKIFFQNSTTGHIAAGRKIFCTTDGGATWIEKASVANANMQNIYFYNSIGYAVGQLGTINLPYKSKILKTTNNGLTWDSIPNDFNLSLSSVFFVNETTGYVGSFYGGPLLKTTNGGYNWASAGISYQIKDMYFSSSDSGYLVLPNFIAKTYNSGINWSFNYINISGIYLNKFSVINNKQIITVGTAGEIIKTTNAGLNWTNYTKSILSAGFNEVAFCDKNTGYISSNDGKIFRTTNGCLSFDTLKPPLPYSWYIYTMSVVNKNVIYGGADNNVYKTTNMGLNWTVSHPSATGLNLLKIKFINENTGYGVSKRNLLVKTTNGGDNWAVHNILSYNENWSIGFYNENIGIAGGVMLVRTSDGGINWDTLRNINSGTDIKYINRDTVFISTFNGIYKSTNGGNNWAFTALPGLSYAHMEFPSEKTGYISSYGAMYKTTDQGEHWFQINRGTNVSCISMVDSVTGYSVGLNGRILKTTDGGGIPSSIPSAPAYIPETYHLYQNYPNPFNPATKIKFELPKNESVKIIIFDILGRRMETLLDKNLMAGAHEINWNASRYAAGVYFYMLITDAFKETKKMILVK